MDMAFLRRAERILEMREPLRLDHQLLIAALSAQQAGAEGANGCKSRQLRLRPRDEDPLIELLLAGPGWREAATRQRGCFNRAEAGRGINGP